MVRQPRFDETEYPQTRFKVVAARSHQVHPAEGRAQQRNKTAADLCING